MTSSSRGRRRQVGRRAQPRRQLLLALGRDAKPALRALVAVVVGLDESVALEPLQRRVHLADVQRPHLAGSVLELLPELQPVLGALAQQRQQGVPDTHRLIPQSSIPGILTWIGRVRKMHAPASCSGHGVHAAGTRSHPCTLQGSFLSPRDRNHGLPDSRNNSRVRSRLVRGCRLVRRCWSPRDATLIQSCARIGDCACTARSLGAANRFPRDEVLPQGSRPPTAAIQQVIGAAVRSDARGRDTGEFEERIDVVPARRRRRRRHLRTRRATRRASSRRRRGIARTRLGADIADVDWLIALAAHDDGMHVVVARACGAGRAVCPPGR